jgi:predicted DNA-binding WGR domain protein
MKNVYLENTNNHHDKFYHMIENKDGASFTASWGRTGSNGRTQIYGMNEWDKIKLNKINKGYKSQYHNKPTNWIQGMSVAQRKKQGITTVQPFYQPKKSKKKADKKIHYDVGQVDVEVNHSHQNKLRILKMTMENWAHDDGKNYALDSRQGRLYEADLHKVNDLMEEGREILTKEEMLNMNVLFKIYGGKRVTQ